MKLERIDEHLTTATVVILGVVAAYWCGLKAGAGELGTLFGIFGLIVFMGFVLVLRQNIWMMIPVGWVLVGALPDIPFLSKFNPALKDLIVIGVAVATFVLVAFKVVRFRPKFGLLDFMIWSILLYLVTVFLRNPVGVQALGSERIGGRPYMAVAIGTAAYWVLARAVIPGPKYAQGFLYSFLGLRILNGLLSLMAEISEGFAMFVLRFYTGIDVGSYNEESSISNSGEFTGRRGYLLGVGEPCVRWLIAKYPPLDVINPLLALTQPFLCFRFCFFLFLLFLMALGGFRSAFMLFIAMLMVSTWIQQGIRAAIKFGVVLSCMIALLVLVSPILRLPLAVQRALSFLPGNWDPEMVAVARASSDWRYYMWRQMLTTNRYIDNRWLGDGFGFSMRQFQLVQMMKGRAGMDQEAFLIVGQVHSGPITAIRYVGYVGCIHFIALLIIMSVMAFRLCRRAQGTPYFTLTLFLSLPIVVEPFNFIFIFGSYDYNLPEALMAAGMLKMLGNTLDRHEALVPTVEVDEQARARVRVPQRFGRIRRPALAPSPTAG